ncbi:MAG: sugar transferase [Cyanobacteria bacterium P01_H01_bin.15]
MTAKSRPVSNRFLGSQPRRASGFLGHRLLAHLGAALNSITAKRLFDILFSASVLVLCAPVYLLLTVLVRLSSPGPIFYVQKRVGKDFRPFNCIKFRTMVIDADVVLQNLFIQSPELKQEYLANFKLKKDPRITWIGRFLRRTSLDEFPQFWNVLRGQMSVVGPRPLVPEELEKYGPRINTVLTVRPGITGLWQVSGRNDIPYPKRVQIDIFYATRRHLLMDFWIVFKTAGVMFLPGKGGGY